MAGKARRGATIRVAVRLGGEAAEALQELALYYGTRTKAVETALVALRERRAILERLDRIEARLAGVQVMPVASPEVDATAAVRAVTAGILALADDDE